MILFLAKYKVKAQEIWNNVGFQKYFQNTGWMFAFRVAGMFVSFLAAVMVARFLGPDKLGTLNYAVSFVGIFSFLATLGLDSILYRDLISAPENYNKLLGTAFWLKIFGAFFSFITVIIAILIVKSDARTNIIILIIASGYIFQSFGVIMFHFQSKVKLKTLSVASFIGVLFLSFLKALLVILNADLIYFAFVLLIEPIFYAISYYIMYKKSGENIFRWRFDRKIAKKLLAFSWPLMFTGAFAAIYSRIDQVMIGQLIDAKSVGVYSVAAVISEYWYFVPLGLANSLLPAIINGKKTSRASYRKRLNSLMLLVSAVCVVAALFFSLFSKDFILFFYGASFIQSVSILKIYIWAGVGFSLGFVVNQLLLIENKTKLIFLVSLASMVVNIALNIILIPKLGMRGAALATLISYSIIPLPILFIKY